MATLKPSLSARARRRGAAALAMAAFAAVPLATVAATGAATGAAGATGQQAAATRVTYVGYGFDACSAPSIGALRAWLSSGFRALNIYVGGMNRGCSQPNLTSSWVSEALSMGWHLVPTYVGAQAPTPRCGCWGMSRANPFGQGEAAASDAAAHLAAIGIGRGNPVYFDMEGYTPGPSNTPYVLAFLEGWTERLHAEGYLSGVYSSASSGIHDLVGTVPGHGYVEPDDIWIADWNGQATESDGWVPANFWIFHQRVHQFTGSHTDNFGGVSINIDSDWINGAVVG